MTLYKKPTLTEIKKKVKAEGGTYYKLDFLFNGKDAYRVNGVLFTKNGLIEAAHNSELPSGE